MKELVLKYLNRHYYVNHKEYDVRRINDNSIMFLVEIQNDIVQVFGFDAGHAFLYINDWLIDKNNVNYEHLLKEWEKKPHLDKEYVYAPYIIAESINIINEDSLPSKKIASKYAIQIPNQNFYEVINITNIPNFTNGE